MTSHSRRWLTLSLFLLLTPWGLPAETAKPTIETPAISIVVITNAGKKTNIITLVDNRLSGTVAFKYAMAKPFQAYTGWGLEVTEPGRNLTSRFMVDGKIPPLIHWDGKFGSQRIKPDEKYYARLHLKLPGGQEYVSQWTLFRTVSSANLRPRIEPGQLEIDIVPWGTFNYSLLKAQFGTQTLVSVEFEPQVVISQKHSVGLFGAVSTNILADTFNLGLGSDTAFYSQMSLYYRYNLVGGPIRRPNLPFFPPYLKSSERANLEIRNYSKKSNLQLGIRLYDLVLRGITGTASNSSMVGRSQGFTGTINFDFQAFGPFRIRTAVEGGYSFLRGKTLMGMGQVALTYEGITDFSPGLALKYLFLSGMRDGRGVNLTNHLISAQIVVQGKI